MWKADCDLTLYDLLKLFQKWRTSMSEKCVIMQLLVFLFSFKDIFYCMPLSNFQIVLTSTIHCLSIKLLVTQNIQSPKTHTHIHMMSQGLEMKSQNLKFQCNDTVCIFDNLYTFSSHFKKVYKKKKKTLFSCLLQWLNTFPLFSHISNLNHHLA